MTAAENSNTVRLYAGMLPGLAACLSGSTEMAVIYGKGVYEAGTIKNSLAMLETCERGRNV